MTVNLSKKRFILMDLYGVVWKGNQVIDGDIETLKELENQGFQLGFVTNNSSLSRKGFIQKLAN